MNSALILLLLTIFLILAGVLEYALHCKHLYSIPIRIHVNGTRGKSSVTRLIAAGLNEGGIKAFAKTTGTLPVMISSDGSEYPIFRFSRANIIEQIRIVAFAARNGAKALVIECMALQPHLQSLCELKLIRSTHGIITNAREDHLDIMGPSERDVALSLLGSTPYNSTLFTCEVDYPAEFREACLDRKSDLVTVSNDEIENISDEAVSQFSYLEHKDNIALALKVCVHLGVPGDIALRGMRKVTPDPGAMTDLNIHFFGRNIFFINGFAANDPESTEQIWRMALEKHPDVDTSIMIINTRIDRPDRSRQFGLALPEWPKPDKYILIGSGSYFLLKYAVRSGINPTMFIDAESLTVENIFEEILTYCKKRTLIMGIGNIAGPGLELIKYFKNRSDDLVIKEHA